MVTVSGKLITEDTPVPIDLQLINAAARGDNDAIRQALTDGADIHTGRDQPLHVACANGERSSVELLLDLGADIHAANDVGLRWAAENGHRAVVELLLDRGANIEADEYVAFRDAAINGHTDTLMLLLDRGADIHAQQDYALDWAALGGHNATVTMLLDRGADIHAKNDQALYSAATGGHAATMDILIKRGADIHADNDKALRGAVEGDHIAEAILLLRHGADPKNAATKGPFGYQKVMEWVDTLKEAAAEHFTSAQPSRKDCFTTDTRTMPPAPPKLHVRVLDACATGQFVPLVGAPLVASGEPADRELFQDIWKALPRDWQNQYQNIYLEFAKAGSTSPIVGSHTAASQQPAYGTETRRKP